MPDTTDSELCFLIINVCKPPTNFNFPENEQPLGLFSLKSFHEFVILGGSIGLIACLVFYLVIKMWENIYKKPCQTWQTALKTFKNHQNVSYEHANGTYKKRQMFLF